MTGLSLRDQLLKAGLVSEKQARQAEQQQKQRTFKEQHQGGRKAPDRREAERLAAQQQAAAAKAAKDAELNRKREEKAAAKARWAEIRQIVEQNRIARPESDDYYNFIINKKVGRIAVDATLRGRIVRGELGIVRCDGHYELLPSEACDRIREREPRAVVPAPAEQPATPLDDAYKDYVVPDDLMW
jgi:uncharacterized protein YaiL (DUF2058 family)